MGQLYPTHEEIDTAVLAALKGQPYGKDPKKRPKPADAYQLAEDLPDEIALPIIDHGGHGGAGGSKGDQLALTQEVQFSCQRLKRKGLVRIRYKSTRHMAVWSKRKNDWIVPSFEVCGEYELKQPGETD